MQLNDLNLWRSVVTVAGLVLFLVLIFRTWSHSRAAVFDEAARLPFAADDTPAAPSSGSK